MLMITTRERLEMRRVDTCAYAATMMKIKPVRNFMTYKHVCNAMCLSRTTIQPKLAI